MIDAVRFGFTSEATEIAKLFKIYGLNIAVGLLVYFIKIKLVYVVGTYLLVSMSAWVIGYFKLFYLSIGSKSDKTTKNDLFSNLQL